MQRDNQGRQLLRLPTTMRLAFADAQRAAINAANGYAVYGDEHPNLTTIDAVCSSLRSNHGYRKVPAWTVTRKGKR